MQRPEYAFHAVFHRQDKTGGQLPQTAAGIHQGGGIGQKFCTGHHFKEDFFPFIDLFAGFITVFFFCFGDVPGHPPKHLLGSFNYVAFTVFFQIASF